MVKIVFKTVLIREIGTMFFTKTNPSFVYCSKSVVDNSVYTTIFLHYITFVVIFTVDKQQITIFIPLIPKKKRER